MSSPYRELPDGIPTVETDYVNIKIKTTSGEIFDKKIVAKVYPGCICNLNRSNGTVYKRNFVCEIYKEHIQNLAKKFIDKSAKDNYVEINYNFILNYQYCESFSLSYGKNMILMEKEPHNTPEMTMHFFDILKVFYKESDKKNG